MAQTEAPGTERPGSDILKAKHAEMAQAIYQRKALGERVKALKVDVLDMAEEEGIDTLKTEVDYGGEQRICKTTVSTKRKLSSRLLPKDAQA